MTTAPFDRFLYPAAILAGGRSRRMGFPKLLLADRSGWLLERTVEHLRQAGWGRLAVVVNELKWKKLLHRRLPEVEVIVNPDPEAGMISSVRLALVWAGTEARGLLMVPVDHPPPATATLRALRDAARPDAVAVPVCQGRRGHPVWWGRAVWDKLTSPVADRGAHGVLRLAEVSIREVPVDDPAVLANLNTEADAVKWDLRRWAYEQATSD